MLYTIYRRETDCSCDAFRALKQTNYMFLHPSAVSCGMASHQAFRARRERKTAIDGEVRHWVLHWAFRARHFKHEMQDLTSTGRCCHVFRALKQVYVSAGMVAKTCLYRKQTVCICLEYHKKGATTERGIPSVVAISNAIVTIFKYVQYLQYMCTYIYIYVFNGHYLQCIYIYIDM